ncbi:carboxypeptidase regulatory-like domain-containing protein [Novipirellula sp. SH528]|uniref:carboxypeptidase regulatory-like domain-containing protein n=1 Tax=Novipirellula sp. SH528 TaxID=3454466 RepID=UPI003FA15C0A
MLVNRTAAVAALLFVVACGCSGESAPDGLPDLYPTTLTIHQSGSPLVGASVQLVSTDPVLGKWVSGGSTNDKGEVVVMTHGNFEGAPAGKFKVTVNKTLTDGQVAGNDPGVSSPVKMYDLVDAKYRNLTTTPIEVEIAAGENKLDVIDVGAAVKDAAAEL